MSIKILCSVHDDKNIKIYKNGQHENLIMEMLCISIIM